MILLYTTPGCASCRKAKRWLQEQHLDFIEKNFFSNMLSSKEIKYLLNRCENGTEDLISTRSKAFNELNRDIDDMTINELVMFIRQNPSVMRRPIILTDKVMQIGFDEDDITAVLPPERRTNFIGRPGTVRFDPVRSEVWL